MLRDHPFYSLVQVDLIFFPNVQLLLLKQRRIEKVGHQVVESEPTGPDHVEGAVGVVLRIDTVLLQVGTENFCVRVCVCV